MEREDFLTGYCRKMNGSRTVAVETVSGKLQSTDCDYGVCPYEKSCPIIKQIAQLLTE